MGKKRLKSLGYALAIGVLSLAVVACGDDDGSVDGGSTGVEFPASFYISSVTDDYVDINVIEVSKGLSPRKIPTKLLPAGSSSHLNSSIRFGDNKDKSEALTVYSADNTLWVVFRENKTAEDNILVEAEVADYTIRAGINIVPAADWVTMAKIHMNDKDGSKVSTVDPDDAPLRNVEIGSEDSRGDHSRVAPSGMFTFVYGDAEGNSVIPSNPDVYITNTNEEVFKTRLVQEGNTFLLEVAPNAIEKTAMITIRAVENSAAVAVLNLKSQPTSPQITPLQDSGMYIPDNFDAEELQATFAVANMQEGMKVKGVLSGTNDILEFKGIGGDEATIADGIATFTLVKGGTTRTVGNIVTLTATMVDESQNDIISNEDSFITASTSIKVVDVVADKVGDATLSAFCQGFNEFALSAVMDFPLETDDTEILGIITSTVTGGAASGGSELTDLTLAELVVNTKAGDVVADDTEGIDGKAVLTCVGNLPVGEPTFVNGVTTVTGVDVTMTEASVTAPLPVIALAPDTELTTNKDEIGMIYLDIEHYNMDLYDVLVVAGNDPNNLIPEPGEKGAPFVTERKENVGISILYTLTGESGVDTQMIATVVPQGETDDTNAIGTPLVIDLKMTYN